MYFKTPIIVPQLSGISPVAVTISGPTRKRDQPISNTRATRYTRFLPPPILPLRVHAHTVCPVLPTAQPAPTGYDGGDCCSCTCDLRSDVDFSCTSVFVCRDPYADCGSSLSSAEFNYLDRGCTVQRIGDGSCDEVNNVEDCLWDGGDCCSCTCNDGPAYVCGTTPGDFDCQDPNSRCDSEMVWVPAVGAVLGVLALGFGCFAIYRYGVRKRRERTVSAAIASVFGAVGVESSSSQRSSQLTSRIDDEALAVAQ